MPLALSCLLRNSGDPISTLLMILCHDSRQHVGVMISSTASQQEDPGLESWQGLSVQCLHALPTSASPGTPTSPPA